MINYKPVPKTVVYGIAQINQYCYNEKRFVNNNLNPSN